MAATDEELQILAKPPIFNEKEDAWSAWIFVMTSYVSLLFAHVPALLVGAEASDQPGVSMARIRTTLTEDGVTANRRTVCFAWVKAP